ncbi:hypothetical protein DYB32_008794 [Aphanomyces invadans]|uniref:Uncharacterized protein n=1 Tax=Aphanomyces invadans TaxID=157072 RepID=A0A418AK40_9STRA|nr:hypothetical protein DYB32_008794 [Aphanomyces invadans]
MAFCIVSFNAISSTGILEDDPVLATLVAGDGMPSSASTGINERFCGDGACLELTFVAIRRGGVQFFCAGNMFGIVKGCPDADAPARLETPEDVGGVGSAWFLSFIGSPAFDKVTDGVVAAPCEGESAFSSSMDVFGFSRLVMKSSRSESSEDEDDDDEDEEDVLLADFGVAVAACVVETVSTVVVSAMAVAIAVMEADSPSSPSSDEEEEAKDAHGSVRGSVAYSYSH